MRREGCTPLTTVTSLYVTPSATNWLDPHTNASPRAFYRLTTP